MAVEIFFNNEKEIYRINEIAKQADGSAWIQHRNTVLLATVVMDELAKSEDDFLPLTVQYIEKFYSVGKIPGGFIKREGKPGDFEILTSRIVDRALRPLFPKGFNYPVQITIFALSVDRDADLQVLALKVASAALFTSSIPVQKFISAVRIGMVNNQFVIDPDADTKEQSSLDLFVAGSKDELLMIEMRSIGKFVDGKHHNGAIPEEKLIEAISLAQNILVNRNITYEESFSKLVRPPKEIELFVKELPEELTKFIEERYSEELQKALSQLAKSERATTLYNLATKIVESGEVPEEWSHDEVLEALQLRKREIMRKMVLETGKRADGRGLKDVRPISIETNILPQVHGSCLFTRGQTQALVTLTIGSGEDAQIFEELTELDGQQEKFMVHYNFPGFSVGEASRIKAIGRRELGHGNLAKRALESSLENRDEMTIRLVSEILESNGSSSMATVCGGSLALKAGNQKMSELIAGVAMGLITEEDRYAILTDILGLEDHDGDMDFKVAGSRSGITALQMDIKLGGISLDILSEALEQAREGRFHILNIMEEAERNIVVNSDILPKIEKFRINPTKVVDVIGPAGKVIKGIIEKYDVKVDIDRETGDIKVVGRNGKDVEDASKYIQQIADDRPLHEIYEPFSVHTGVVKSIAPFGAFISLPGGHDGMIHISKIGQGRINRIEDYLNIGDEVLVEVLSVRGNKIELRKVD
ncbi:MAG TPA: polyribonucleotide nucleotidyltransferase [Campylobacterales bacterium]|nr:polyribonucleotide nucleotidyltransferase [Campylobacterales bacterium]